MQRSPTPPHRRGRCTRKRRRFARAGNVPHLPQDFALRIPCFRISDEASQFEKPVVSTSGRMDTRLSLSVASSDSHVECVATLLLTGRGALRALTPVVGNVLSGPYLNNKTSYGGIKKENPVPRTWPRRPHHTDQPSSAFLGAFQNLFNSANAASLLTPPSLSLEIAVDITFNAVALSDAAGSF